MSENNRIVELETRVAHQDETIHVLSDELFQHQKKLDHLEATCHLLTEQVRSVTERLPTRKPDDDKPPHY